MVETKTKKRHTKTTVIEDNSPDYLLPSNGGYNPKVKSIYIDEEEEEQVAELPVSPQIELSAISHYESVSFPQTQ